jgi:hypothetical protein
VWEGGGVFTPPPFLSRRKVLTMSERTEKPFTARFIGDNERVLLELTNTTDEVLKSVEILSIFLKDQGTWGGVPSRSHIKFDPVKSIKPKEKAVMAHRTLIGGKPADAGHDQLERLRVVEGAAKPYVLDISWEDGEGKTRYQRIPVGH